MGLIWDTLRFGVAQMVMPKNMTSHDLYREMLLRNHTDEDSGQLITTDLAMRLQAVYSCIRVLGEDIAGLPFKWYERKENGDRGVVNEHWLVDLIRQPNSWQTEFEFREMKQAHIELSGNFYALKTVLRKQIVELLPIAPYRVQAELDEKTYRMKYKVTWPNGQQDDVPQDRMYHVRGLTLQGGVGVGTIQWQRETLGFARGLSKYGSKLFKQGAMIGGVIEMPPGKVMTDKAYDRLKASFDEKYSGVENSHKAVLLEEGAQFKTTGMKATDAEFINSKKYSRTEIAGMFRVPPHFIGDLDRATFSNIEQQSLDYVQKGLLPRLRRIEARMLLSLVPEEERRRIYGEHLVDGLLRGDYATRQRGYQTAILTGYMTRNEARRLENMNAGPKELDEFLVPTNMAEADQLNKQQDAQKKEEESRDGGEGGNTDRNGKQNKKITVRRDANNRIIQLVEEQ